jgi:hypothetical protein
VSSYRVPDLDSFHWQSPVKDKDLNTPPGSPAKGDRYIVGPSPTGAWAGHTAQIAYYDGSAWAFVTLAEGLACWVEDENKVYIYNGASWAEVGGGGGGLGYTLNLITLNLSSMANEATYYLGNLCRVPGYTEGIERVYIPKTGTIKIAFIYMYAGTVGTNEDVSVYIRKNGATDTLVATVACDYHDTLFYNASLSISVNAGDYIQIKVVCPVWATRPAAVLFCGSIYIE